MTIDTESNRNQDVAARARKLMLIPGVAIRGRRIGRADLHVFETDLVVVKAPVTMNLTVLSLGPGIIVSVLVSKLVSRTLQARHARAVAALADLGPEELEHRHLKNVRIPAHEVVSARVVRSQSADRLTLLMTEGSTARLVFEGCGAARHAAIEASLQACFGNRLHIETTPPLSTGRRLLGIGACVALLSGTLALSARVGTNDRKAPITDLVHHCVTMHYTPDGGSISPTGCGGRHDAIVLDVVSGSTACPTATDATFVPRTDPHRVLCLEYTPHVTG